MPNEIGAPHPNGRRLFQRETVMMRANAAKPKAAA